MDLGLGGKWAIVCGASQGLGEGCARSLAREGVNLVVVARTREKLETVATSLRASHAVEVKVVSADLTSDDGRNAVVAACQRPDILVTNGGGPPPGDFRDWKLDDWISALGANMLAPIDLIRRCIDGMIERRYGRIVNITSSAVKSPAPLLGLSNGARAGLTGFVAGLAREIAPFNVTVNNLLPGFFATQRLMAYLQALAVTRNIDREKIMSETVAAIPAGRLGNPEEFGDACAFLCGTSAGFITGQNLLLDGGTFRGVF